MGSPMSRWTLHVIRNDTDHANAVEVAEELAFKDRLSPVERSYLDVLWVLIEKYESERHEIDVSALDPLEIVQYLAEQSGMTASDLGRLLGNRALGSKIMRGERELSKDNIRVLADHFNVEPGIFLKTSKRTPVEA